ncbi:MAG: flagellar biosynthesis protein FlhF [Clostridium sp.]|nr:flagellar biosynthesis protein FlhF [Clostridium sp.]
MIIKKYLADTEAEAVDAAKKELGPGVVVMNVRSVKHKGIMRFFKNPMKEVTVALEEDSERFSSAVKDIARVVSEQNAQQEAWSAGERSKPSGTDAPARNTSESAQGTPGADTQAAGLFKADGAAYGRSTAKAAAGSRQILEQAASESNVLENKLDSLQSLLQETLVKTDEKSAAVQEESEEPSEAQNFLRLLYNTMVDNEVDEHYANQIIDTLDVKETADTPIDYYLASVYQKMVLKFGKTTRITEAKKTPKVVYFIGPTGVGKTTTIAKIASRFCVEQKKKLALLTTDTYRIVAAEQLKTYADILEVPIRVIYSIEEMEHAFSDFRDYDYILVDTAGHSHYNEEQRQAIGQFIHAADDKVEKEVYLVMSATTKYRDMISIADAYSEVTDYKLIFTKLDETTALGNLFNLRMRTNAELSYVTTGQNVPEDIEPFNPQIVVKQLLGGRRQEFKG